MKRTIIIMLSCLLLIAAAVPAAMAAQPTVAASLNDSTGIVTITGSTGAAAAGLVTVQVRNAAGQIDFLDMGTSDAKGDFQFSYKQKKRIPGTYAVSVGGQFAGAIGTTSFPVNAAPHRLAAKLTPEAPDGQNGWYRQPVRVAIEEQNGSADAAAVEYRINQGEWTAYADAFTVAAEGTNVVEYRSVDDSGVRGDVQSTTIRLDRTAPVTTAAASPVDGKNGWYVSNPTLTLTATDNVSVAATVYRVDGGLWSSYTQPVTLSVYGTHSVEYKSVDQAGNEETAKSVTMNIDKVPPTVRVVLDKTTLWPANKKMVTVTASVYAADDTSQIDSVVLKSITSSEPGGADDIQNARIGTFDTSFSLRAEREGRGSGRIYTITYTATDKAGNKADASATVVVPHDQSGKPK
ncbi:DUF5011 domain-containing protein [Paenibacillus hamazuiensis]|uniref:DUF5011 domain-containing protein n=1 Tax=Paenibacillus hamazuiensis TaxID=2936508 RepID=UPI00200E58A9|nr:DUF5011 domain-containing protein [Paenibacillus hamazuiensis]